jgi:hypothetical protein
LPGEWWTMTLERTTLALVAAMLCALSLGAQRVGAATVLGSLDPRRPPEGYACEVYLCPSGTSVGFRQLALYGSDVVAREPGVLVSARVNATRIAGVEQPRIAVLPPSDADDDDIGVTVAGFAPLPVVSDGAAVHEVEGLHLRVESGDSIGFLLPGGEVDLGLRARRQPDGSVQSFTEPCSPCGLDGGTGRELLLDAHVEPDADEDLLGDESQDPDFGGGGEESDEVEADELDDWFDELGANEESEGQPELQRRGSAPARRLRLLDLDRARNGDVFLQVRTPRAGLVGGIVTSSAGRWDLGVPRTLGVGEVRVKRKAQVRLRVRLSRSGRHVNRLPGRRRARVVVYHLSSGGIKVTMRQIRL